MSFVYYNEKQAPPGKRLTLDQFLVAYWGRKPHAYKSYANGFILRYGLDARAINGDVIHRILRRRESELSAGTAHNAPLPPKPKPPAPVSPVNTRTGLQDGNINQPPRQRFGDLDYQQKTQKKQNLFGDTLR
jgi:hypothetical protein